MLSRQKGIALWLVFTAGIAVAAWLAPRTPQPVFYDDFADHRSWLGVPNFGNVVSNVPFAVIGIWGLLLLSRKSSQTGFMDSRERLPYFFLFLGLLLTAFGSSYYHLAPGNTRLVWDRLPMTIVFMALVAAMVAERISVAVGLWLLPLLLALGVASVLQWRASELAGKGDDLRFYVAVQAYSLLTLLVALLLPPRYTQGSAFLTVAGLYVLAKVLESADRLIFSVGHIVSGHTLKHLAAATAGYWILRILQNRQPLVESAKS